MANWSLPSLTDLYSNFLTFLKGRDDDAVRLNDSRVTSATNVPDYAKRWNDSEKTFQNWLSEAWSNLILSVAGGGTGATTASGARTNLDVYSKAEADAAFVTSLSYMQGLTSGTVTLTSATTYYDCVSLVLATGTWLIIGSLNVRTYNVAVTITVDLWDGTHQLTFASNAIPAESAEVVRTIPVMHIEPFGASTTVKIRAWRTGGTSSDAAISGSLLAVKIV